MLNDLYCWIIAIQHYAYMCYGLIEALSLIILEHYVRKQVTFQELERIQDFYKRDLYVCTLSDFLYETSVPLCLKKKEKKEKEKCNSCFSGFFAFKQAR